MMLPSGSNTPIPVYQRLYPRSTLPFEGQIASGAWTRAVVAPWGDYVMVAYASTGTTNNRLDMYHVPSGTWTTATDSSQVIDARSILAWPGTTWTGECLYASVADHKVYRLFPVDGSGNTYWTGTTGMNHTYKSGMVTLADETGSRYNLLCSDFVRILWTRPSATQTATIKVYANGNSTAAYTGTASVAVQTDNSSRVWTTVRTNDVHGRELELEITGAFTRSMTIQRIEWGITSHGTSEGQIE